MKACSVDDCQRAAVVRELCTLHYARKRKSGEIVNLPPKDYGPCSVQNCSRSSESQHLQKIREAAQTVKGWQAQNYTKTPTSDPIKEEKPSV